MIATLVVGVALFAAGCGGDDSSTDSGASGATGATGASSGAAPSQDQFITQADAICTAGNKTIDTAGQALGGKPQGAALDTFANDVAVPALETELDALKALTPPEGDEDAINTIISDAQDGIDQVKDDPSLLVGDGKSNPFAKANQEAKDYGLNVCGQ